MRGPQPDARGMLETADGGAGRLRAASTKPEGRWILALGLVVAIALLAAIRKVEWWESTTGFVLLLLVYALAGIVSWRRAVNRTVRPRYFSAVLQASMVWSGLGLAGSLFLAEGAGGQLSWATSILAAALSTAPIFACGVWLMRRSR